MHNLQYYTYFPQLKSILRTHIFESCIPTGSRRPRGTYVNSVYVLLDRYQNLVKIIQTFRISIHIVALNIYFFRIPIE